MDINTLIDNVFDDFTKSNNSITESIIFGLFIVIIRVCSLLKDLFTKVKSIKTNKFELIMKPDDEAMS